MPFQPVTIDSSITRIGGGSVYVHEGYYQLKVQQGVLSPIDHSSAWSFITWDCRIEEGLEGIGRTFKHTTTLMPDQQWALGSLLHGCGIEANLVGISLPTYQDAQTLTAQLNGALKDKTFVALIADGRPGREGQKNSDIKSTFLTADWETLKKNNERYAAAMLAQETAPAMNGYTVPGNMMPANPFAMPAAGPAAAPLVTPELQGAVANVFAGAVVPQIAVPAPIGPASEQPPMPTITGIPNPFNAAPAVAL